MAKKHKLDTIIGSQAKVKVGEIESYNKFKKSLSIEKLIIRCKEMEQGLVHSAEFVKARDTEECTVCREPMPYPFNSENHEQLCSDCKRAKIKVKIQKQLGVQWRLLEKELKSIWKGYKFDPTHWCIKRTITLKNKSEITFEIERDTIYGGNWTRYSKGHVIRIRSDRFGVEATRLKKDFGAKGLAKGLHNRIGQLVDDLNEKNDRARRRSNESQSMRDRIVNELKVTDDKIDYVYNKYRGRGGGGRLSHSHKQVNFLGMTVEATEDYKTKELIYIVKRLNTSLSAKQLKQVGVLVKSFRKGGE